MSTQPQYIGRMVAHDSSLGSLIRRLRNEKGLGLKPLARLLNVTHSHLSRVERGETYPSLDLLHRVAKALNLDREELELRAGVLPSDIASIFSNHPHEAALVVRESFASSCTPRPRARTAAGRHEDRNGTVQAAGLALASLPKPAVSTDLGALFQVDCLEFLRALPDNSVDVVFADPPFNLGKDYGPTIPDKRRDDEYIAWSREWLLESARVLSPGGALFVFNLPKWLVYYGTVLNCQGMTFRHWIACRMPKSLPIPGRLSPAHYGLLYYTKGKPRVFNKVYVPIPSCRHCGGDLRDYGGHRKFLNAKGLNLMDVWDASEDVWSEVPASAPHRRGYWREADEIWDDIPPVRHSKYKLRGANELAPVMLERIVAFSSGFGDLVVDPFAGTGTTLYAAEKLGRRWLGSELGDVEAARRRMNDLRSGERSSWESARGHSKKYRHGRALHGDQLTLGTAGSD